MYNAIQEEMFKTMFRFRKVNIGRVLEPVSPGEYKMLDMLAGCPGKCQENKRFYISELAVLMKVSVPAVSRLIKTMEKKGYIARSIDEKDHRSMYIVITGLGWEVCEECRRKLTALTGRVIDRMEAENVQQLIELLNHMLDIMTDEIDKMKERGFEEC